MIFININITTIADSLLKGAWADALVQFRTETSGLFITTEDGTLIAQE